MYIVRIERIDRRAEERGILPFLRTIHVVTETEEIYRQAVAELDLPAVVAAANGMIYGKQP